MSPPPTLPGEIARVRQRQYLVEEIVAPQQQAMSSSFASPASMTTRRGRRWRSCGRRSWTPRSSAEAGGTIWPARGFDPPRLFSAYLHTLRWNCVTATNPRLFQAPYRD